MHTEGEGQSAGDKGDVTTVAAAPAATGPTEPTLAKTPSAAPPQASEEETKATEVEPAQEQESSEQPNGVDEAQTAKAGIADETETRTVPVYEVTGKVHSHVHFHPMRTRSIVNVFTVPPSQTEKADQSPEDNVPSDTTPEDTSKPAAEEPKDKEDTPVGAGIGAEVAATPATAPHYDGKKEEAASEASTPRPSDVPDSATAEDKLDNEEAASRSTGASAKRPYENTPPFVEDNMKPHKMPKVDDSEDSKTLDKDVNGSLQDGKASELDLPGTFPTSAPASVAAPEAVQDTEAKGVGKESSSENKTADISSAKKDYEQDVSSATTESATEVGTAPPVEVPGPNSEEVEKQPTQDAGEALQKPTEPTETVATNTTQAGAPAETKGDEVTENATSAANKTEEAPSSTDDKPSTSIPSVVVSEPSSQADDSAKPSEGQDKVAGGEAAAAVPAAAEPAPDAANKEAAEDLDQERQDLKKVEEEVKSDGKKDVAGEQKPEGAATRETTPEAKAGEKKEKQQTTGDKAQENAAKEADKKSKDSEKSERKKGGLWNWLKRKIKGEKGEKEKGEKSEKQPEGAGGSQVTAPAGDRAVASTQ